MLYTNKQRLVMLDENLGIVKGYGSIFGNVDSDNDIIEKGAYARTIKNNGSRVKYLYQHDITKPIGRMKELFEDENYRRKLSWYTTSKKRL
jgi:HK97 family phage prohead protease